MPPYHFRQGFHVVRRVRRRDLRFERRNVEFVHAFVLEARIGIEYAKLPLRTVPDPAQRDVVRLHVGRHGADLGANVAQREAQVYGEVAHEGARELDRAAQRAPLAQGAVDMQGDIAPVYPLPQLPIDSHQHDARHIEPVAPEREKRKRAARQRRRERAHRAHRGCMRIAQRDHRAGQDEATLRQDQVRSRSI